MRPIRAISAEEERFRFEPFVGTNMQMIKRDPVEPEPLGTIVLMAWRVVGYDKDCDGSLMARLEHVALNDDPTEEPDPEIVNASLRDAQSYAGVITHWGLYPASGLVVTPDEFTALAKQNGFSRREPR